MMGILVLLWLQGGQPAATGTLEGVVLNAVTKEPVRKAEVRIQAAQSAAAAGRAGSGPRVFGVVTDSSGRFSAPGLDAGEYTIFATKAGFLNAFAPSVARRTGSPGSFKVVNLGAGETARNLELLLTPGGVVAGRVVDEDGDPMPGVSMTLWQPRGNRLRGQQGRMTNSQTNDKGEFRIANVMPGKYVLSAEAMGRGGMLEPPGGAKGPEVGYTTTYFPGVTEAAQAAPVEVGPGQELTGLEVALRRTPVFRVRGRVVDNDGGKPGERAYVFLARREERVSGRQWGAAMMEEGRFEVSGVPAGSYVVVAQRMDRNEPMVAVQQIEISGSTVDGLTLTLQAGTTLQGRIVVEGQSSEPLKGLGLNLASVEGFAYTGPGRAEVKDDGTMVVKNVFPGRYRLNYYSGGRSSLYLASAKYNDVDVTFAELDIAAGSPGALTLVFRSDGGSVTGTVRSGDSAAAGASVALIPVAVERRTIVSVLMISAGADGAYKFGGLRPGDYYVLAVDGADGVNWDDPEWVKSRQDKMTKVSVSANGTANVPLQLLESEERK